MDPFEDDFNEINFCIASPIFSFLEEIQDHLIKNCKLAKTKISSNKNKTCYNLRYGGNLQVRKIFEYLYPDDMGDAYLERKYNYCKQHFYNLDNNTKSRNRGEPTLNQYSFTTDLRHLQILKSSEILQSHTYNLNPNPNPNPEPN